MQVTLVQFSTRLMGNKANVSECHKRFKESSHIKITNEHNAHSFLHIKITVRFECYPTRPDSQLGLCGNTEAVT
jgi:hypothetical protein